MISVPFSAVDGRVQDDVLLFGSSLWFSLRLLSVPRLPRPYVVRTHCLVRTDEHGPQLPRGTRPLGYRKPHGLFECGIPDQLAVTRCSRGDIVGRDVLPPCALAVGSPSGTLPRRRRSRRRAFGRVPWPVCLGACGRRIGVGKEKGIFVHDAKVGLVDPSLPCCFVFSR